MTGFDDIALAITVVFLLASLLWSVLLRRRIKEQTQQIRLQLEREMALERQYHELFENANDIIFSLDPAGRFRT